MRFFVEKSPSAARPPRRSLPRRDTGNRPRLQLVWTGMLQTARGPLQCLVADLGKHGARLSPTAPVEDGQAASLVIRGMGTFRGEVVRREGGGWGMRFSNLSPAEAAE